MSKSIATPSRPANAKPAPRQRILEAAAELFAREGIRGVGVQAIAEAARTTKMGLYRHFASKDELVVAWLRGLADQGYGFWDQIAAAHPGNPRAQLNAVMRRLRQKLADPTGRGCPFANSLAELPRHAHPARRIIESYKARQRARFVRLCRQAGVRKAHLVADELFFLFEGAQVSAESIGPKPVADCFHRMATALIAANVHRPRQRANSSK